ncbi:MAG: aminotransferase class I/II-fold pyridoxal phosphate-dependent enzyme [Candidatus Rokuibacteriota bacterium]|nr:aminotransferase class I/II-fold pyridoxal phosphate-dependent enzyme [Patescibacteria group bacterium]
MLDNLRAIAAARQALLNEDGVSPFGTVVEKVISTTEGILDGRRTILAGTNNYLGLTFDPVCIEAACTALRNEGTGTTGSRMANGTFAAHTALERELAAFFGRRDAMVFSTGYIANLGMLSALTGRDDVILIDADCHASIYDGCRLGTAEVIRFRHNNPEDLDIRMRRLGERTARTLIVVEGIYSMLGDRAPLAAIAALKRRYGAWLLVDEAHSFGVLGAHGRGLAEEAGVEDAVDFVVGTFSKSLGTIGGFSASDHPELDSLRYASRPYLFTASPSPSIVASARAALGLLQGRPELRKRLWENAHGLYERLRDLGFALGPEPSPIVAVMMATPEEGLACWRALLAQGVYVNLIVPPAAPNGGSLLRCSVGAAHTPEQIERIAGAFATLPRV